MSDPLELVRSQKRKRSCRRLDDLSLRAVDGDVLAAETDKDW